MALAKAASQAQMAALMVAVPLALAMPLAAALIDVASASPWAMGERSSQAQVVSPCVMEVSLQQHFACVQLRLFVLALVKPCQ